MTNESESDRKGVIAVITQDERFLVIRRSRHVRAPRAFCFPGGEIEPGETEPRALRRELQEELAAPVRAIERLWQCVSPSGIHLAWWKAALESEQAMEANPVEVESIHWYTPSEILGLPELLPTNRAFLQAWRRGEFRIHDGRSG